MQTDAKGYPIVEMRDGVEVRRLRGACLENCFKEVAVAKEHAQLPTSYRFRKDRHEPWEERVDADVLNLVWPPTQETCLELDNQSYEVRYAQSTYERTDKKGAEGNGPETRSNSGFSVDLTVNKGGRSVWLETVWSDTGNLATAAKHAKGKLAKYKSAVAEARKFPQRWRLDENLGGAYLQRPSGFGTLAVRVSGYRLEVEGEPNVTRTFGEAPVSRGKQPKTRNKRQEALYTKRSTQKKKRSTNRTKLRGSKTRKKPASATPSRVRQLERPTTLLGRCVMEAVGQDVQVCFSMRVLSASLAQHLI